MKTDSFGHLQPIFIHHPEGVLQFEASGQWQTGHIAHGQLPGFHFHLLARFLEGQGQILVYCYDQFNNVHLNSIWLVMNLALVVLLQCLHALLSYLVHPEEHTLGREIKQWTDKVARDIHSHYSLLSTLSTNNGMAQQSLSDKLGSVEE